MKLKLTLKIYIKLTINGIIIINGIKIEEIKKLILRINS